MSDSTLTLADFMRQSETDPFLFSGPPAPDPGRVYRDFSPMPCELWLTLIDLFGDEIQVVAANSHQLPPAKKCRAQLWIGPNAQKAWTRYLASQPRGGYVTDGTDCSLPWNRPKGSST